MVDILTKQQRAVAMGRVKGKNTKPELLLRKALHHCGMRYRLHATYLPGSPDLVFRKHNAVIFVHGCFWHRHAGCGRASMPSTNVEFWSQKFERNIRRDNKATADLVAAGWRVFVVWECQLSSLLKIESTVGFLKDAIAGNPRRKTA